MIIRALFIAFGFQLCMLAGCSIRNNETGVRTELNRLEKAGSPYLVEHADNPVNWYEWGTDALEKAKAENKPLIISIGYAACHWCHVMEEESFMDTTVARVMNENFVCIKIDREERPDIDQIYLQAAQLISGNGGWPLNAFTLPGGKPFYTTTYLPKLQWITLLEQVIEVYKKENGNVTKQAEDLTKAIQLYELINVPGDSTLVHTKETYQNIFNVWQSYFDFKSGGLKGSPKFPMPVVGEFLLQHQYLTGNKTSLDIATTTLDQMAMGGIYDQLGGGFSRYSIDTAWAVPHFEKMLYDNGQLVSLYSHAFQITQKPLYADVIRKTLSFVKNEMTSVEGGFYSSLNADSEGEEGKFYVWTKKEIENTVDKKYADLFIEYFTITDSGNWENGKNILNPSLSMEEFSIKKEIPLTEFKLILDKEEQRLLQLRQNRIHPSVDQKILVSWNALMLKGYVDAYFAIGDPEYLKIALANANFMKKNMIRKDGQLWRNYNNGKAGIDAFLDDYALLSKAFIYLYQATFDIQWLEKAKLITEYAVTHFRDTKSGMFYYTSDESENLVARKMELADNVIPASNSVLAENLYFLGEYYALNSYIRMCASMVNQITSRITSDGPGYSNWARLMGMFAYSLDEVAVMGVDAPAKSKKMLQHFFPNALFMGGVQENLPLLKNKLVKEKTLIYVCRNKVCKFPVEDVSTAVQQLHPNNH